MFSQSLDHLPFVCFAHRGASGTQPENTLRAFAAAIDFGSPWLELDVYRVEDEVLVIHDDTLERTTNGFGRLVDMPLALLKSLDAGMGEPIPSLRDVIDLVGERAGINIELKGPATAEAVVSLIKEFSGYAERFLISSFDHRELSIAATLDPDLRLGALFGRADGSMIDKTLKLGAKYLHVSKKLVSSDLVTRAHTCGLRVFVYTLDDPDEITQMMDLKVDGVFSNFPDRVLDIVGQHTQQT